MSEVLITLGSLRFSLLEGSYSRLTRKLEMRIARLSRAGAQTARQILGEDETIEIEGVYFAAWKGSVTRLDDMRALARTYLPQLLTDGRGFVWGKYVVESVEEDASLFIPNGVAMRQGYRLQLGATPS